MNQYRNQKKEHTETETEILAETATEILTETEISLETETEILAQTKTDTETENFRSLIGRERSDEVITINQNRIVGPEIEMTSMTSQRTKLWLSMVGLSV
jgi:hypothetical protein